MLLIQRHRHGNRINLHPTPELHIVNAQSNPVEADQNETPPPLKRSEVSILSPLRYVGSKRRLAGYIARTIEDNGLTPELFIEPFAGGASVALQLLMDGVVKNIGLADRDPLLAAFWKTVFFDSNWIIEQIENVDITLDNWRYFKGLESNDVRDQALKCLYLNRTSFSGIMAGSAGPIGGVHQLSDYKIDCRFPRETLVKRVRQAQSLADRVSFVWNLTWKHTLSLVNKMQFRGTLPNEILYYFAPSFFEKAEKLYTFWFEPSAHKGLRDQVIHLEKPWIMSYDSVPHVTTLYLKGATNGTKVQSLYSASSGSRKNTEEAIITNLDILPPETRLWRTKEEWGRK